MNLPLNVEISIEHLWGQEKFQKNNWGYINFLVGTNGTGKSLFAKQLKNRCLDQDLKVRYLNPERLFGQEQGAYTFPRSSEMSILITGDIDNFVGYDPRQLQRYKQMGKDDDIAIDVFMLLKEKLDLRTKIEASLSILFNKRIRLSPEKGLFVPKIRNINGDNEYELKSNECHGLKEIIGLLTILYDDENNCLILDEPELHLNPQFQVFLLQEIRKLAGDPRVDPSKKCFLLITHSPYFLDLRTIEDLQNCIVFQPNQLPTYLDEIDEDDERKIKRLLPRLNSHHKQFFFCSRPIFVEGYIDQQLFTLIQEKRDKLPGSSNSCFIDVGGKEELDFYFRLCNRLKINAQFITDLDTLVKGSLRRSIKKDQRCKEYLQEKGIELDLLKAFGVAESLISQCIKKLEDKATKDDDIKSLLHPLTSTLN